MTQFNYLIRTDSEPIAVSLTAAGRIALTQYGTTIYLTGNSWATLRTAVDSLHAPNEPRTNTPAKGAQG